MRMHGREDVDMLGGCSRAVHLKTNISGFGDVLYVFYENFDRRPIGEHWLQVTSRDHATEKHAYHNMVFCEDKGPGVTPFREVNPRLRKYRILESISGNRLSIFDLVLQLCTLKAMIFPFAIPRALPVNEQRHIVKLRGFWGVFQVVPIRSLKIGILLEFASHKSKRKRMAKRLKALPCFLRHDHAEPQ